jgi:ATP-dependent RNA helicase RhlE
VLVFSNTKIGASRLARHLEQAGIKASAIHGDKTQQERIAALEAFKKGEIDVLVATDVAARGLDITDLPCVINYDLPYNAEDYVHRIGRTGRAGATGDALSVYSEKDERLLVDIEKLIKQTITRGELTGFAPSRAAERRARRAPRRRATASAASAVSSAPTRASAATAARAAMAPARCRAARRSIRGSSSPTSRPRAAQGPTEAVRCAQAKPKQKLAALAGWIAEAVNPVSAARVRAGGNPCRVFASPLASKASRSQVPDAQHGSPRSPG